MQIYNFRYISVSYFIDDNKTWKTCKMNEIIPKYIVHKTLTIPIPMSGIKDKFIWKLTLDGKCSLNTVTWANNNNISPYPRQGY